MSNERPRSSQGGHSLDMMLHTQRDEARPAGEDRIYLRMPAWDDQKRTYGGIPNEFWERARRAAEERGRPHTTLTERWQEARAEFRAADDAAMAEFRAADDAAMRFSGRRPGQERTMRPDDASTWREGGTTGEPRSWRGALHSVGGSC